MIVNEELDTILNNAEKERDNLKSILVGSEHVLLSMLNPENNCNKIQEVFKNMGVTYNFIIEDNGNFYLESASIDK